LLEQVTGEVKPSALKHLDSAGAPLDDRIFSMVQWRFGVFRCHSAFTYTQSGLKKSHPCHFSWVKSWKWAWFL